MNAGLRMNPDAAFTSTSMYVGILPATFGIRPLIREHESRSRMSAHQHFLPQHVSGHGSHGLMSLPWLSK